jgi:flagellar P-ring protein precursor FlgI
MLRDGDFTTARRIADAVNQRFGDGAARPLDAVSIAIAVPDTFAAAGGTVGFISELESLTIEPDLEARVVINERTGTIVIGDRVSLSTVAISHGALSITIKGMPMVSQPAPLSSGETIATQYQEITVEQQGTGVVTIPGTANVGDVAAALNRLGVGPRDMIAIFQALKESGSLRAELIIL